MVDPLPCRSCSFPNAPGAEHCAKCGAPIEETPERVHPGETRRDPDDLTLPPAPLPDDPTLPPAPLRDDLTLPPSPLLRAVLRGEPELATTIVATPPPRLTRASVEQLSPSADQAVLLRDLAERLHTPPKNAEPVVRYAGFFARAAAFLIDSAVLFVFGVLLAAACYYGLRIGMLVLGRGDAIEPDENVLTLLILAWFVMATIYFTSLHRSHGQTIGKSLLGLQVRSLHLGEIGVVRSLIRTLGYAASSTFFGFGFLLVAVTPRKRGWHDLLAGTCVVRLAPEEAPV